MRKWRVSACCRPMAVHLNYTVLSIMACATSSCKEKRWIQNMYAIQIFSGKFCYYASSVMYLWCQAWRIPSLVHEQAEKKYFYKLSLSWCWLLKAHCPLSYHGSSVLNKWSLLPPQKTICSLEVCLLWVFKICILPLAKWFNMVKL